MVSLRSGADTKDSDDEPARSSSKTTSSWSMTTVIFIGLLIDLLAFTLILPLLPALLDHYRKHDQGGLYPYLEERVKVFQGVLGSPDQFNSVLFGGFIGSLFSMLQFVASPIIGGKKYRLND